MNPFQAVAGRRTKYSKFDLSHERKMSLNFSELIPIMCNEIVPGDKFRVNSEIMMRFAPMVAPMMHRVNVYTHYFFVPNRLLWDNWESFITGGRQGDELPTAPVVRIQEDRKQYFDKGTLADYFGLPIVDQAGSVSQVTSINALPFRAYQLIYNEYYQDQNLSEPVDFSKADGLSDSGDHAKIMTMRKRAWEKDYFTSALPWAQKGESPNIPVEYSPQSRWYSEAGEAPTQEGPIGTNTSAQVTGEVNSVITPGRIENIEGIDINDLRKTARLQEWLERNARAGSRYVEQILSHFGVRSSDARLQRPEYLSGGRQPVVISQVLNQTGSEGTDALPQGNMAGHGISVGSHGFNRRFEEHGFVIGIMSVLPKTAYQQGIHKMWNRRDKLDYYWPEFAQLGEQEVENREIFYDPTGTVNNETFGYQSRYAEYKYQCSTVHGDFRDTLNFWHMGRIFDELPVLNEEFIESNPDDRIFAVTDPSEDKMYCQVYNRVDAVRPMPYFNNPTL